MINKNKWVSTLPKANDENSTNIDQIDHNRWTNTISKKKTFNSFKSYSSASILFILGLLLVSVLKNETRNLQKGINNLNASISVVNFNLEQAILDNEVITSPENISLLAKEYLNIDLISYKRSQIKKLNGDSNFASIKNEPKKLKKSSDKVKTLIAKSINEKKIELKKLQVLYSNPKLMKGALKQKVEEKIAIKKAEIKKIYNSPKEILTPERIARWSVVQVVKLFLGIPVIPGR